MSEKITEVLREFRCDHREDLIPCMQRIQDIDGYISEESVVMLSDYFRLSATKIYGIATFYDYFNFSPFEGDVIRVCNGTSCHMQGSGKLIKEIEKVVKQFNQKNRRKINVRICGCQGSCNAGPVLQVNDHIITGADPNRVKSYINRNMSSGKGVGDE